MTASGAGGRLRHMEVYERSPDADDEHGRDSVKVVLHANTRDLFYRKRGCCDECDVLDTLLDELGFLVMNGYG